MKNLEMFASVAKSNFERVFYLIVLIAAVDVDGQPAEDPCSLARNIGRKERSSAFVPTIEDPHLCDTHLSKNTWYRFDGVDTGEDKMPESCMSFERCGTHSPVWMRGSHPTEQNPGPIEVDACAMTSADECCGWTAKMKVKWCSSTFYAYYLPDVEDCQRSFCFGNTYPCPQGEHWEDDEQACVRTPYPAMSNPILNSPYISAWREVKGRGTKTINATVFSIDCQVGYQQQQADDDKARFEVSFYLDDGEAIHNVTIHSTSSMKITLGETQLITPMGKTLTCRVVAYFTSHPMRKSAALISNGHWFGIKPKSDNHDFNSNVLIPEGQLLSFYMEATFPITLGWCYKQPTSMCNPSYAFSIINPNNLGGVGTSKCEFRLSPGEDPKKNRLTMAPFQTTAVRQAPYTVHIQFAPVGSLPSTIFTGYQIQPISIEIEDTVKRPVCQSITYLHIKPFQSANKYEVFGDVGDFYLLNLKNAGRTIEIHIRHIPCPRWPMTVCNNGVIAREGNNILGVIAGRLAREAPLLIRYLVPPKGSTESTAQIYSHGVNAWQIRLPSGTEVNIVLHKHDNMFVYMNVEVLGVNGEQYTGLCGQETNQDNYRTFRVAEENSFFGLSTKSPPRCVNGTEGLPVCSCSGKTNISLCERVVNTDVTTHKTQIPDKGLKLATTHFTGTCGKVKVDQDKEGRGDRRRRRRDMEQGEDEDTDEDVPIDDSIFYNPVTPTVLPPIVRQWPTVNKGITKAQATDECNSALRRTPSFARCSAFVNTTALVENCILNIQSTEDLAASGGYTTIIERDCVREIMANRTSNSSDTEEIKRNEEALSDVLANILCPMNCSGHGSCANSTCTCTSGYKGADCSKVIGQAPQILDVVPKYASIRGTSSELMATVMISATDIDEDGLLDCKVKLTNNGAELRPARRPQYIGGRLACSVFIDSVTLTSSAIHSISIQISDDKNKYSDVTSVHIYDSQCMTCDDTGNCTVKIEYCSAEHNTECIDAARNHGCSSLLEKSSERLSAGEIVGIVLCIIFVSAVTVAVILFFFMRRPRHVYQTSNGVLYTKSKAESGRQLTCDTELEDYDVIHDRLYENVPDNIPNGENHYEQL